MLRNPIAYQASRISSAKPLFHWSELLRGIFPGAQISDIDGGIHYKGYHLLIEHKTIGAPWGDGQVEFLESWARKPLTWALFVGTNTLDGPDLFHPEATVVCWTWVHIPGWRRPENVKWGGPDEFRAELEWWKRCVDTHCAAANDDVFAIPMAA